MAITFLQQKQRQKYYILGFFVVLSVTVVVFWYGFLREETTPPAPPISPNVPQGSHNLKLNLGIFDDEKFKGLEPFKEIGFPTIRIGRENPFVVY